jgi:hypothetical protein
VIKNILILIFLVAITGCATVPMASLEADQKAKSFSVPPNKSRIYLFRDEAVFGGAIKVTTSINDKIIGQTAPKSYFVVDVPPGKHVLSCFAESNSTLTLNTKKDTAYYVWQEMKMGVMTASCRLQEVEEAEGQKRVKSCKLAQGQN